MHRADTGQDGFTVYDRPVPAYTDATCPADLSYWADGSIVTGGSGCVFQLRYSSPFTKYTVPDGGWASWGGPPDTEEREPEVLASNADTTVILDFKARQVAGGVEIEPDPFRRRTFTVEFYRDMGGSGELLGSITRSVSGRGGAKLFAGRPERAFGSIVIISNDGVGFAIAQVRG